MEERTGTPTKETITGSSTAEMAVSLQCADDTAPVIVPVICPLKPDLFKSDRE